MTSHFGCEYDPRRKNEHRRKGVSVHSQIKYACCTVCAIDSSAFVGSQKDNTTNFLLKQLLFSVSLSWKIQWFNSLSCCTSRSLVSVKGT